MPASPDPLIQSHVDAMAQGVRGRTQLDRIEPDRWAGYTESQLPTEAGKKLNAKGYTSASSQLVQAVYEDTSQVQTKFRKGPDGFWTDTQTGQRELLSGIEQQALIQHLPHLPPRERDLATARYLSIRRWIAVCAPHKDKGPSYVMCLDANSPTLKLVISAAFSREVGKEGGQYNAAQTQEQRRRWQAPALLHGLRVAIDLADKLPHASRLG